MSKISFVVPLYNKEAYIADCLESLLNQTETDIEIIVVDDKSTDDSKEIALFLAGKDKRIKLFELGENRGRSFARNYGNSKAKSKIIAVQDADDISLPERASYIVKAFKKNIDVFYSSFFNMNQTRLRAMPLDVETIKRGLFTYIGHSTMAYKKSIKAEYSEGKWSELGLDDWKLQIDLISNGKKFYPCDTPLVIYRQTQNSITNTRDEEEVKKTKLAYLNKVKL
jgi:glycosyltransferase involved in cell wall biosynthesis